MIMLPYDGSH